MKRLLVSLFILLNFVVAKAQELRDFGDAPASYGSADHVIDTTATFMGLLIDAEGSSLSSNDASGDDTNNTDDEDGAEIPDLKRGEDAIIRISVTGNADLNGWIDWNGDGDFSDADEWVIRNINGSNELISATVSVPAGAIISRPTFARFRFGPNARRNDFEGSASTGEVEDYMITIGCLAPSAPITGTPTQPTCTITTGSVELSGLPSGSWVINPGAHTGSTSSTVISGLAPGTYNFAVTNNLGCTSPESSDVVINTVPLSPSVPVIEVDCAAGVNNGVVRVTSPVGVGYTYRLDDGGYQASNVFTGVANGNYRITVRNAAGCTTTSSVFSVFCQCTDPPTLTLSSAGGSVCGTDSPVTVNGNTFGGSATVVSITENGSGSVNPEALVTTPFSFTYTPAPGDAGETVTITVRTNNPLGEPCQAAVATYTLIVNRQPSAPVIGNLTQPTCLITTGSVTLNGLPATGVWTLIRNPGNVTTTGSGTNTTITGLGQGTYTFVVRNAGGCTSSASAGVIINPPPEPLPAPVTGTVTHPTCISSTGSVVLSGLPTGEWTIVRTPGNVRTTGSGSSRTVTGIPEGTYTFVVINSAGCTSLISSEITINPQPPLPAAPGVENVIHPTCTITTGNITLNNLPPTGSWTLIRNPGNIQTTGTGVTTTISELTPGTYRFAVTNASGCTSANSRDIVINPQPVTPTAPIISRIIAPTCLTSGIVQLSNLPSTGLWTITKNPGNEQLIGTGITASVQNLVAGTYTFSVTNASGCQSPVSQNAVVPPNPEAPVLRISNPDPVCSPATVNITVPAITAGSTNGLTFSYWSNPEATVSFKTPQTAGNGVYYIKGTDAAFCTTIKPVTVVVKDKPVANAGPNQTLEYQFETTLNAVEPAPDQKGLWSVISGTGIINDPAIAKPNVINLSVAENKFLWTITNNVCPPVSDSVTVFVKDLIVPSLITPNNDGRNEYLIIAGAGISKNIGLTIFDRRGARVYRNDNYDNDWNGVDDNNNPLEDDTYFYVIKTSNQRVKTGFIVLRH